MISLFFAVLILLLGSDASVDFSYSTIYDMSDFEAVDEILIPKCGSGCLIFASTLLFSNMPDQIDPYAKNMYIVDNNEGEKYSFTSIAALLDQSKRKVPLEIKGPAANISLINLNDDKTESNPVVLYVIDRTKAQTFSYAVYDPIYSFADYFIPTADIVTIMCAQTFRVNGQPLGSSNAITARLAGFENVKENNEDGCPYAYKMPAYASAFPGFELNIASPIVSIDMGVNNNVKLDIELGTGTALDLSKDGFISSSGFNGCAKHNSGGHQNYLSEYYSNSLTYDLTSQTDYYQVSVEVEPWIDANHYVRINDYESDGTVNPNYIRGYEEKKFVFSSTNHINIDYYDLKDGKGFIMRYSTTSIAKLSTTTTKTTTGTMKPAISTTQENPQAISTTTIRTSTDGTTVRDQSTTSSSLRISLSLSLLLAVIILFN